MDIETATRLWASKQMISSLCRELKGQKTASTVVQSSLLFVHIKMSKKFYKKITLLKITLQLQNKRVWGKSSRLYHSRLIFLGQWCAITRMRMLPQSHMRFLRGLLILRHRNKKGTKGKSLHTRCVAGLRNLIKLSFFFANIATLGRSNSVAFSRFTV